MASPDASSCISIPGPARRPVARYALEEAALRLGLRLRLVEGEPQAGQIVYGPVPVAWRGGSLAYDERSYDPATRFEALGTPPLWAPRGSDLGEVDLIGGLARLLTLADEKQIDERSR